MSDRSEAELSEAIQRCALECAGQPAPSVCVRNYCARLVREADWSQQDADAVEYAALRVIERLRGVLP